MHSTVSQDGHSGGETPGPIPNPAVKSARVPICTVLRKRTGTQARCLHFSSSFPLKKTTVFCRILIPGFIADAEKPPLPAHRQESTNAISLHGIIRTMTFRAWSQRRPRNFQTRLSPVKRSNGGTLRPRISYRHRQSEIKRAGLSGRTHGLNGVPLFRTAYMTSSILTDAVMSAFFVPIRGCMRL